MAEVTESKSSVLAAGAFMTGLASTVALLYFGRALCITIVIAVILSFLLEPFVALFMRLRLPRVLAAFVVCSTALLGIYFCAFLLYTQLVNFADDIPEYSQRLNLLVDRVAAKIDSSEQNLYRVVVPRRFQEKEAQPELNPPQSVRRKRREPPPPPPVTEVRIHQDRNTLVHYVAGYVSSFYNTLLLISFVPFLVFFTLSWRDHISRSFLSIYASSERSRAGRSWREIAEISRAYVVGNVILGLIISVVSCAIFFFWSLPYWLLVGCVSGFLSLVPYIGLPLAVIPPLISALMTYDALTPYLIIGVEIAAIHLLALNLLYPAVVGARVHLNPLAVTLALMFWGTVWGAIGLVLAIPITAALKTWLDNTVRLQGFGRLLGDQITLQPPLTEHELQDVALKHSGAATGD